MTLLQKSTALIQLIRPELPIAAGVCVVVGQAVALGALPPLNLLLLGFALGLLLSGSAMVFNDYFDLAVDRVNAPGRPIPSGRVSPSEAVIFGSLTGLAALAAAWAIGPLACALSLGLWILGFLYNWKLKAAGLWGNLIVALNVAMTIILGGISVGQAANPLVWVFGALVGTFDLAEEIAGDAMDMEGDRQRASQSLALVHGKRAALRVSGGLFGLVILLSALPLFLGESGPAYWAPIVLMDGIILVFAGRLLRSQTPQEGRRAMRVLYLSASVGLLAFLLARFLP